MVITTDNIDGKFLSYYIAQFQLTEVEVINQLGDTIPVNAMGDSAFIGFYPTAIQDFEQDANDILLFPDPANNVAHLQLTGGKLSTLIISDMLGQQIVKYDHLNSSNFTLPTGNLTPGVYIAQMSVGNRILEKKFLVQH